MMKSKTVVKVKKVSDISLLPGRVGRDFVRQESPKYSSKLVYKKEPSNVLLYTLKVYQKSLGDMQRVADYLCKTNKNVVVTKELYDSLKIIGKDKHKFFAFDPTSMQQRKKLEPKIDLVICFGGDGTLLAANSMFTVLPPIIGYKPAKSVGFLLDFEIGKTKYEDDIDLIFNSKALCLERSRMKVQVMRKKSIVKRGNVLNDIFVTRNKDIPIVLELFIDGEKLNVVKGDGVCVSTSTGSTGYSMSSSGPVVHPSLDCFIINTLNCSIPFGLKPYIFPSKTSLTVKYSHLNREDATISYDAVQGESVKLELNDLIEIEKAESSCFSVMNKSFNGGWIKKLHTKHNLSLMY